MNWYVIYNERGKGYLSNIMDCRDSINEQLDMEGHIPRVGEYIVAGDVTSNDKGQNVYDYPTEKVYIVKEVFYNIRRKDVDIYLEEVDKTIYPMFKK